MFATPGDEFQFGPPSQSPLAAWNFDGLPTTGRRMRVGRIARRHRTDLSWIPVTLLTVAATLALCMFAKDLVKQTKPQPSKPGATSSAHGTGRAPKPKVQSPPVVVTPANDSVPPLVGPKPMSPSGTDARQPGTNAWVGDALQACRDGRPEQARALAKRALRNPQSETAGRAVSLLIEYLRQYEALSRQAFDSMNGAVVIDLGPDRGIGAFVERDGDKILFHCLGRSVWLTQDELWALEGARFRITRDFLANGNKPANDLILAAAHIIGSIDEAGNFDTGGEGTRTAARARLAAASAADDPVVASHATLLMSLIEG